MVRPLVTATLILGLQAGQVPSGSVRPAPAKQLPPLTAVRIDAREIALDSPRRLTLSFAAPQPIDQVLGLLIAGTSFSLAIDADAAGSVRGELKELRLREALDALLVPLGLDYQVQGTVIRVRRQQSETRLFELD